MMNYTDEEYHQMHIEDYYSSEIQQSNLFAISRIFAAANKQMTISEYKTLTFALKNIKWTDKCPDTIYLDKKELAEILGITSDYDHISQDLKRSIGNMPQHSFLEFDKTGKEFYMSGNFVRTVSMYKNVVRIRLEEDFLNLFGNLDGKQEVSKYITLWADDVFQMKSIRAVLFYELLRDNSDTRLLQNTGTVSIKKFKEMFNIPKEGRGSYMRNKDGFDRANFEKRVIEPICEELSKSRMIQLMLQSNGKYYEKVKRGNRVIAYRFYWAITTMPTVVTAIEDKAVNERVVKNPDVMKVANDILKGEKKPKKKKENSFNNFEQRDYSNYKDLENKLLGIT